MKRLHALRIQRRTEREKFFLRGTSLCFQTALPKDESNFDREGALEQAFWLKQEPSKSKGPYAYGSIQALGALLQIYNLQILISDQLTSEMVNIIHSVLERAAVSKSGFPHLEDLRTLTHPPGNGHKKRDLDLFELKMSRLEMCNRRHGECTYEEDLLHEMFISFHYTNRLRKMVPNFQLAYAGIKASSVPLSATCLNIDKERTEETEALDADQPLIPPVSPRGETKSERPYGQCACDTTQSTDYLILEKLEGVTLSSALRTCTLDEYLNWLVQIVLALETGVVSFGFTHYNLHTDNIVVVPLDKPVPTKVKYWFRNQILLVPVSSLAVIKNFELAHVKHRFSSVRSSIPDETSNSEDAEIGMIINNSEHFGAIGHEKFGIFHNETRPFYDLYKLIFWSLNITGRANHNVYQEIRKISKFFGYSLDRDLLKTLKDEEELGYMYSSTIGNQEKLRSLGEFFSFLLQTYPQLRSTFSTLESYTDSTTLHCDEYCPLNGHQLAADENIKTNPLRFLGIRFCLERRWGLTKRVEELSRLSSQVCRAEVKDGDGNLCQPATEELMDAQNEQAGFEALLGKHGEELYLDGVGELEQDRLQIEKLIKSYNLEIEALATYSGKQRQERLRLVGDRLARQEEIFNGRLSLLIRKLLLLNQFADELGLDALDLSVGIPDVASLDPEFDSDLGSDSE